jgi:hypothetical protein
MALEKRADFPPFDCMLDADLIRHARGLRQSDPQYLIDGQNQLRILKLAACWLAIDRTTKDLGDPHDNRILEFRDRGILTSILAERYFQTRGIKNFFCVLKNRHLQFIFEPKEP